MCLFFMHLTYSEETLRIENGSTKMTERINRLFVPDAKVRQDCCPRSAFPPIQD